MMWRCLVWLLLPGLLSGATAWYCGPWWGLAVSWASAVLWVAWDGWQMRQLRRWLMQGELMRKSSNRGMWLNVATAVRRNARSREQVVVQAQQRVQDLLAALQASPNALVLLDAQGHIEWCNQMAERHFGFDAQRDVGQAIGHLLRDPAFNAYWSAHDFRQAVVMVGRESSATRPVMLSVTVNPYGEGRYLMLARDITQLEQAEAMRRDFVANVSHEIRTPLTVLVGFVETLQSLPLEVKERNYYLSLMAQQASRMQNLVQDLLTLSRLEGSPLPGYSDWTPIAQLLRQCEVEARGLSTILTKTRQAVHVITFPAEKVTGMDWEIAGVQAEIMSAFSNLISNALRYTPAGGNVEVVWETLADGSARFAVKDSGPGIDAAHIGRLTERFYRVDRSRSRDTGGTGLGLAIVKHALQRHGAKLEIHSRLGEGATFSAIFPPQRLRPMPKD